MNETLTSGEVAVLSSSLENIAHALNSTNDTTAVTNENITNVCCITGFVLYFVLGE